MRYRHSGGGNASNRSPWTCEYVTSVDSINIETPPKRQLDADGAAQVVGKGQGATVETCPPPTGAEVDTGGGDVGGAVHVAADVRVVGIAADILYDGVKDSPTP